ncbi:MAG TPA: hypothetical protein VLA74_02755 [Nitrososphaeraceae archaeon]|nr:hypothetical protein [Nitrososphaeraceae archaeon]
MKKLSEYSSAIFVILVAGIAIISGSTLSINEAMAFPHASIIIESDEGHVNPIELVLGHSNEPAYGKLPGIHDGKHNVEVRLSDANTVLPLQGGEDLEPTTLLVDKYYFKDTESFQRAQSLEQADDVELDAPITSVFGQPGLYYNRQVIDSGIYGYTIKGVLNYYDQGLVPVDVTKFCSIDGEDLTKFDRPMQNPNNPESGWQGSFGCPQNIKDIFFPRDGNKYPNDGYPPQYPQNDEPGNY